MAWAYKTTAGTFTIHRNADDRYELAIDRVPIGTYDDPDEAAQDLAAGVVFQPPGPPIDYESLDIPSDLHAWEYW